MFNLIPSAAMIGSLRSCWRRTSEPSSTLIFGLPIVPVTRHYALDRKWLGKWTDPVIASVRVPLHSPPL
jgi:hypothetical protein